MGMKVSLRYFLLLLGFLLLVLWIWNKNMPSSIYQPEQHVEINYDDEINACFLHHKSSGQSQQAFMKKILISGGAGFVGSHLVDALVAQGHFVVAIDNFYTGSRANLLHLKSNPCFSLIEHDVSNPIYIKVDEIYHLASPASPPKYMMNPVKTMKANILGSLNLLGLAKKWKAKFLLASTSEVYGDPDQHPQRETYWGSVNPIGPRSCYDESKRAAEAMANAYYRHDKVDIRVARIFNTYGPRMSKDDGRVVSNFIVGALKNEDLKMYGDGSKTRSFQYISDLVEGLILLMNSNLTEPVNLGNPVEFTILELAKIVIDLTQSKSIFVNATEVVDDPKRRKPDITRATTKLNWTPKIQLREGLKLTIDDFRKS